MTTAPNPDLDLYLQEIGRLALEVASDEAGAILVYAEVEQDELTADIFFQEDDPDVIEYRLCPPMLEAVIEAFRDAASIGDARGPWVTMTYVLENEAFKVELKYEADFEDETTDISDRRPAVVRAVLGDGLVDYSRPGL